MYSNSGGLCTAFVSIPDLFYLIGLLNDIRQLMRQQLRSGRRLRIIFPLIEIYIVPMRKCLRSELLAHFGGFDPRVYPYTAEVDTKRSVHLMQGLLRQRTSFTRGAFNKRR